MPEKAGRRTTIVYFNLYTGMGGGEYSLFYLLKNLDRTKFRPIMMFNKRGLFVEKVEAIGVETAIVPYEVVIMRRFFSPRVLVKNLKAAREIHWILKRENVDVLHCSDVFALLVLLPSLLGLRIPVIYSVIMHHGPLRAAVLNLLAVVFVDRIITISQALKDEFLKKTLLLAKKITVGHLAVDPAIYYPRGPEARKNLRVKLGLPLDRKLVGFVGRYEMGKGHITFLESARRVLAARRDVQFLMVGGAMTEGIVPAVGRYREKVIKNAADLLARGDLIIWGHRDDIPDVLASLDVFVCPSDYEGFGLVVLEAVASGVPSVVSEGVGALEVLDGCAGVFRARPGESQAFAERIQDALAIGGRYGIGETAFPEAIQRRSWADYADRIGQVYRQVA